MYEFLLAPNYITVYRQETIRIYYGQFGQTDLWYEGIGAKFQGYYGSLELPETMPVISFPFGTDAATAIGHPLMVSEPSTFALLLAGALMASIATCWRRWRGENHV